MPGAEKPVVLMVDDDRDIRKQGDIHFRQLCGHRFISAATFATGVKAIHTHSGQIVAFVDLNLLGEKSGFDFLRYIHENASHRVVPYAFTAEMSPLIEQQALEAGAYHVFHKGVDTWDRLSLYATTSHISKLVRRWAEDDLTGLDNFHSFRRAAIAEMRTSRDHGDQRHPQIFSLLFIDLDKFKTINDTHGHLVGDLVLKEVANELRHNVRPADHICRKGGDEFLVWLPDVDEQKAIEVAQKLQAAVASTYVKTDSQEQIFFSISVGSSQVRREEIGQDVEETFENLIKKANRKEMGVKESRGFSSR